MIDPIRTLERLAGCEMSGIPAGRLISNNSISCNPAQLAGDRMQFDRLKRREFITLIGGAAAAWPLAARAQQAERVRRVGVLMPAAADDPQDQARVSAFAQGLQQLGWSDGLNVRIDIRWAGGTIADTRELAAERGRAALAKLRG